MKSALTTLLLLAFAQVAVHAQALAPSAKAAKARRMAAYARTNEQFQAEIRHQQMVQEFQAMQRIEALREARAAAPPRPTRTAADAARENPTIYSRYQPKFRPDESGIVRPGYQPGGPGPLPHSKNIRTGDVIPSFMIPKGYGRYYTSVGTR